MLRLILSAANEKLLTKQMFVFAWIVLQEVSEQDNKRLRRCLTITQRKKWVEPGGVTPHQQLIS
jgi:hypothetical protein